MKQKTAVLVSLCLFCISYFPGEVFADAVSDYSYELRSGIRVTHEGAPPAQYTQSVRKQGAKMAGQGSLMVSLAVPEAFFPSASAVLAVTDSVGKTVATPKPTGDMILLPPGNYALAVELMLMDGSGSVKLKTGAIDIQEQAITSVDVVVNEVYVAIVEGWVNQKGLTRYQIDVQNTTASAVDVYWAGERGRTMDIADSYGPLSARIAAGSHDFCVTIPADRVCVEGVSMKPDYQYLISIVPPAAPGNQTRR